MMGHRELGIADEPPPNMPTAKKKHRLHHSSTRRSTTTERVVVLWPYFTQHEEDPNKIEKKKNRKPKEPNNGIEYNDNAASSVVYFEGKEKTIPSDYMNQHTRKTNKKKSDRCRRQRRDDYEEKEDGASVSKSPTVLVSPYFQNSNEVVATESQIDEFAKERKAKPKSSDELSNVKSSESYSILVPDIGYGDAAAYPLRTQIHNKNEAEEEGGSRKKLL